MLLDLSSKAQVPSAWLMILAGEVKSSGRCCFSFWKVSTEQMLRPQQEWPSEASWIFKINSMSSAYSAPWLRQMEGKNRPWCPCWWVRQWSFALWLLWRWQVLSDKQVTMNSAGGSDMPSWHREYFGLNLCCEQWLSPGPLRAHWRWFMWVSCTWALIIHMIINKK